jgi:hypothetical protein
MLQAGVELGDNLFEASGPSPQNGEDLRFAKRSVLQVVPNDRERVLILPRHLGSMTWVKGIGSEVKKPTQRSEVRNEVSSRPGHH